MVELNPNKLDNRDCAPSSRVYSVSVLKSHLPRIRSIRTVAAKLQGPVKIGKTGGRWGAHCQITGPCQDPGGS